MNTGYARFRIAVLRNSKQLTLLQMALIIHTQPPTHYGAIHSLTQPHTHSPRLNLTHNLSQPHTASHNSTYTLSQPHTASQSHIHPLATSHSLKQSHTHPLTASHSLASHMLTYTPSHCERTFVSLGLVLRI